MCYTINWNDIPHIGMRRVIMTKIAGTQLISRTCQILRSFSNAAPDLSLAEISKKCKLPPTTTFRILQALVIEGFVIQVPVTTSYRLGYGLVSIDELAKLSTGFRKCVPGFDISKADE
jgi:hypothetical protein